MVKRFLIVITTVLLAFFNFSSAVGAEGKSDLYNEDISEEQQSSLEENTSESESYTGDIEEETSSENEKPASEVTNESLDEEVVEEKIEEESQEKETPVEAEPQKQAATKATLYTAEKYALGDSGNHIVELKEKLVKLGFAKWNSPSPIYGKITSDVVTEFQAYYDLSQTGVADSITRSKIDEVLNPPYKIKDRGAAIIELKENLVKLGYANWKNPSQFYGQVTANVVTEFQSDYGLSADGIAGSQTISKMKEALAEDNRYKNGDSGQHIVVLKQELVKLGFASWKNPSKYYGTVTSNVVRDFQAYYGLPTSGDADQATRNKISQVLNPPYQNGDRGEPIVKLKTDLVKLGFASWKNPSQIYGTVTANVVKEFQKANKLTVDGIAGLNTLDKIEELLISENKYSNGDSGQHIVELKESLVKLGFASWKKPSKYYGTVTSNVVRDFQSYYGLPKTGQADAGTRNKIAEVLKPPYRIGDRGVPVVELKKDLVKLGFANWANPSQFYGTVTGNVVRDFQSYYGLSKTGIVDNTVLSKIEDILLTAYQPGDSGAHIKKLKEGLTLLGFANWSNPTSVYGSVTANVVSEFQEYYNLKVNGMVDEVTLNKLEIEVEKKLESMEVSNYEITLEEALNMQMKVAPQTDHLGYVNAQYTEVTGILTGNSNLRAEPNTSSNSIRLLNKGSKITILERVQGENLWAGNKWYKVKYDGKNGYIYANLVTSITAKVKGDLNLRVRAKANTSSDTLTVLPANTVVNVLSFQKDNWLKITNNGFMDPLRQDVSRYLNPDNNDKYQHLDLSSNLGLTNQQLNKFIDERIVNRPTSVLKNQGDTFKKAAAMPGQTINELYLISHAMLETAYGTSNLASGKIEVGEISNNKWVAFIPENNGIVAYTAERVIKDNKTTWVIKKEINFKRSTAKNIKSTYNMFGIEAVDSHAEIRGSIRAYREGWFNVKSAIEGGAKFIAEDYIHNQYNQNTLYKMRWNPTGMDTLGYATKQYATDIRWAVKQVNNIKSMLSEVNLLDSPLLKFNFIEYKK